MTQPAAAILAPVPGTNQASLDHFLTLSCDNAPGIVAEVANTLFKHGGNIQEANQFDDADTGRFFMRVAFAMPADGDIAALREAMGAAAERFGMTWKLRARADRPKVMLLASKFHHCLNDLLSRWHSGEMPMEVVGVISNHPREVYAHVDLGDVPFHHLPITKTDKPEQEAKLLGIVADSGAEVIVLARYMQVLSDELAGRFFGRCINIHHSFLPGFKGAKPYHQAHARGVKMIGATAHYVTAELDEGPIIEQEVERVSHKDRADDLVQKGRDIERRVLARALALHLEDRVLLNGHTTVVFRD
jgi:formyltetrahydrofolate deformylase